MLVLEQSVDSPLREKHHRIEVQKLQDGSVEFLVTERTKAKVGMGLKPASTRWHTESVLFRLRPEDMERIKSEL